MDIYMIRSCVIILRFITPSHLHYFLVNFNVTTCIAFLLEKASLISFAMRSLSNLWNFYV